MTNLKLDLISNVFKPLLILSILVPFTGCGKDGNPVSSVVTNVQVKTFSQDGDDWVQASATLNTGGFMLASLNVPITDPRDHSIVYGHFSLLPFFCGSGVCQGGGELKIGLNLTDVSKMEAMAPILPNGTPIPVGGLGDSKVIVLPIADTGARLYFAFGPGVAMLGTAITFSQLDPAGQYVPGVNIFQPIQAGPISLTAGMFFGAQTNTTGVGLFIDLSGVMNPRFNGSQTLMALSSTRSGTEFRSALKLKTVKPSARVERAIYEKLYYMSRKGITLQVK